MRSIFRFARWGKKQEEEEEEEGRGEGGAPSEFGNFEITFVLFVAIK